jgi:hypothetical protein
MKITPRQSDSSVVKNHKPITPDDYQRFKNYHDNLCKIIANQDARNESMKHRRNVYAVYTVTPLPTLSYRTYSSFIQDEIRRVEKWLSDYSCLVAIENNEPLTPPSPLPFEYKF